MSAGLVLLASEAPAQSVTGALEGRALTGGAPARGVEVTLRSASLLGTRRALTDERGRFVFPGIPAGTYTVELRAVGFAPVRLTDVSVPLGTTTTVDPITLQRREVVQLDEIVISAARPIMDVSSAAAATVLDSSVFRALPTDRDVRSLLSIVPMGNPSFYGDGVNVAGSTGFENAYYINGIHATNPLSADGGLNVPFNFVKEVQVVAGGYEAEFGRGQGAIVNVLTNRGGNVFQGEVVGYYAGQQLRSTPRWGIAESPSDRFSLYDIGASVGGPIRRDRLWFFAAWNPLVEDREVAFRGLAPQSDRRVRQLFAGTLTWKPAARTDVSLSLLGDPTVHKAVSPAEVASAPLTTISDPRVVLGDFREGGVAGSLQARHQIGSRIFLTGSLTRLTNTRQHARRIGADDPVSLARIDDYVTGVTSGNFGRSYRVHSRRDAADAAVTILAGTHTVKLGGSYERNAMHVPFFRASFVSRLSDSVYRWSRDEWGGRGHNTVPALFAQDSWEVSPRLRLNYGLRWDAQLIRGDTGIRLSVRDEFAPRLGIVFQPGDLGAHKITASFGRFYEQIPLWAVSFWTMLYSGSFAFYPANPVVDSTGGAGGVAYQLAGYPVDSYVKGQHYDEVTAGYERRVGATHRVGVRAIWRDLRWVIEDAINRGGTLDSFEWHLGNPGRGLLAHVPRARRRYAGVTAEVERGAGPLRYSASYTWSKTRGNYAGEFETDTRVPASHFQQSLDWPVQWPNNIGYLPNDRRHLAKLSGSWQARHDLTFGVVAWYASGTPLSEFSADPFPYSRTNLRPRGTAGRTPDIWNADIRIAHDLRLNDRWRPQLVLDVFNIGNQRKAVDFDQLHHLSGDPTAINSNYMKVNQYQAPLRARAGLVVGF